MEDHESGYYNSTDYICEKHFADTDVIDFIKKNGSESNRCSFCEAQGDDNDIQITVPFDDLMGIIVKCIRRSFDDPGNGLSYDSREGGYLGETFDTIELLNDVICFEADGDIIETIARSIIQEQWTWKEFYGESISQELTNSWVVFSELVKYKVRYLFHEVENTNSITREIDKPYRILNSIGKYIEKLNLFSVFPYQQRNLFNTGTVLFRARQHKNRSDVKSCEDICSPPSEFAGSNRFSAEGVSLFYGAEDESTAIEEIIDRTKAKEYISVAQFLTTAPLNLIDLRNAKTVGFFNYNRRDLYEPSKFLSSFIAQISMRHEDSNVERIEFVPSQIVTEYFRYILGSTNDKPIHGIVYKSTLFKNKNCYVVFADNSQCQEEGSAYEDTLLAMKKGSIVTKKISELLG